MVKRETFSDLSSQSSSSQVISFVFPQFEDHPLSSIAFNLPIDCSWGEQWEQFIHPSIHPYTSIFWILTKNNRFLLSASTLLHWMKGILKILLVIVHHQPTPALLCHTHIIFSKSITSLRWKHLAEYLWYDIISVNFSCRLFIGCAQNTTCILCYFLKWK